MAMERVRAIEVLGKLPKDDVVMQAIRTMLNDRATLLKTALYDIDFSQKDYQCGKVIASLQTLEYVLDLPASCALALEQKEKPHEEAQ